MKIQVEKSVLNGEINAVPSKSYFQRYVILSAFAKGKTVIHNLINSDDVQACLRAVQPFCKTEINGNALTVTPTNVPDEITVDVGESGATLRFAFAVLCALGVKAKILTHGKLTVRPMDDEINVVKNYGVTVEKLTDGYMISGKLSSNKIAVDTTLSSQFLSGFMLAYAISGRDAEIAVTGERNSFGYALITAEAIEKFGVKVEFTHNVCRINANNGLISPRNIVVEGDYSAAFSYLTAGVLSGKTTVKGLNPSSLQPDKQGLDVLRNMGVKVETEGDKVTVYKGNLKPFAVDVSSCPDLFLSLCALAFSCQGECVITGTDRLKFKESDRLKTAEYIVNSFGGRLNIHDDYVTVTGGKANGVTLKNLLDHRALTCAVAIGLSSCCCTIDGAECVNKSDPEFISNIISVGGIVKWTE